MFDSSFISELFPLLKGIKTDFIIKNDRSVCYCEKTNRLTDEKYILEINGNTVKITCSGEKSGFYALCDIAKRVREENLTDGEYICAPAFSVRGYIEGFYGTPWTRENRLSIMTLMAKNRMNTVYHAPKDDPYHRDLWRDLYPEEDLLMLEGLLKNAKKFYMDFCWCIAPGLSMKYSDENEFDTLINKTKQLYSIGIRNFGLLLDDIDEELFFDEDKERYGETVNAHIDLINRYHNTLTEIDSANRLTVCPTLYHGKGNEYYISKLGQNISPMISLFWTGKDICSREIRSCEAVQFIEGTRHKPLYWDNYPVNDCAMHNEMHISPIIGRDADLYKYSEGIIANCMEYAECSKIPLITIADYLWDSENYDSETSFENAVRQVIGKEDAESFLTFADHLYTSCLLDGNSRRMNSTFREIAKEYRKGNKDNAFELYEEYLTKLKNGRDYLRRDIPICTELKKWAEKYAVKCDLTEAVYRYIKTSDKAVLDEINEITDRYYSLPAKISEDSNISVEFEVYMKMLGL